MALYVWGSDQNGELGLGGREDEESYNCPQKLHWNEAENIAQAALGDQHSLFLLNSGRVYSCGNNEHGQLGLGQDVSKKRPHLIEALGNYQITQIACGLQHSVAVSEFGSIYVWGSNNYGQCGLENEAGCDFFSLPKLVKTLATDHVVQVACGQFHTLALTNSGDLYSFGANMYGQLGLGSENEKVTKPTLVKSLQGIPIAHISCGANHSFILSTSGSIYGFGKNIFGQLGIGDIVSRPFPTHVKTLRNQKVRYISCGDEYSTFLTHDGGVFTTGLGSFGQLGHGTYGNEVLPRKVLELMGTTVSQIACGKRHTMTFLPSRNKIYGFGLGGCGQLASGKDYNKSSLPQACTGPWFSNDYEDSQLTIKRMFAGGDHCLVSLSQGIETDDYRVFSNDRQIWSLTKELSENCAKCEGTMPVDLDIMTAIEVIFKSLACINDSFLSDKNVSCTSKNHGVDLHEAEQAFESIRKIENESLKGLIWESITNELLSLLVKNPPDIETLRIYLTLPLYHEFVNAKNYSKLHSPFCTMVLSLEEIPRKIITAWYSQTSIEYFERLIDIFKDVIKYFLQCEIAKVQSADKQLKFENNFFLALNMLSLLYHINHQERKEKVPYDVFHVNEITEYFDIRNDYVIWCQDTKPNSFYLCNYPFVFDANAKHLLLQTDQALQMHIAMQNAATQGFFSLFGPQPNVYFVLTVSRQNIVEDTIRELHKISSADLKKPLRVKFIGEEAEDTGGVRKEFFMLLLKDILDTKYGMFQFYDESRCIWFAETTFEGDEMYHLVGILCGLAIYNFNIINLTFPLALYKKLLGETPDLSDLKELSPLVWKSMQSLLEYQESDFEEVFGLTFEVTRNVYGESKTIELKPNGSNIPMTLENKKEYVDLYVDYVFNKSVEKKFKNFQAGFMRVCGGRVMKLFKPHELMAVIVGNEDYNWEEFEQNTEYKNGYVANDATIRMFWDVFHHELTEQEKKKFLLFLTGSDRIPIQGMKGIKIYIQPVQDDNCLPVAHVCAGLLDLPRYSSQGKLRYKLMQAIQQTHGFSLV